LEEVEAGEDEYPYQVDKVPVQTDLFDHQVMALSLQTPPQVLDQHDNDHDHAREYVEAVEAGDREKEIGEVRGSHRAVGIPEGVPSPPGAFAMEVRPFPGLAAQEGETADDRQDHIEGHLFPVAGMTRGYRQHHRHRAHDQDKGHQAHEYQRKRYPFETGERLERYIGVGPAIAGKPDRAIRNEKSAEGKSIAHQEKPHHQLAILYVVRAFPAAPPFRSCRYWLCHITLIGYKFIQQD